MFTGFVFTDISCLYHAAYVHINGYYLSLSIISDFHRLMQGLISINVKIETSHISAFGFIVYEEYAVYQFYSSGVCTTAASGTAKLINQAGQRHFWIFFSAEQ